MIKEMKRWIISSAFLGWVFFLAVFFVKPIGVSAQYSVLSGIFHCAADESAITEDAGRDNGYKSKIEYYDKNSGELAAKIKKPWNYDFVFVASIPFGALICYMLNKKKNPSQLYGDLEKEKTVSAPKSFLKSYLPPFLGGFILLFAARMADGCTSGHMMSGIMQGSISGFIFAVCAFATAIPSAIIMKKAGK